MELHLLIADSRRIYRKGLRDIFSRDPLIASVDEAANTEDLQSKLAMPLINAVIVNQSLLTDLSILPESHAIVIAAQPDQTILSEASKHGLSGYFLDEPDEELLRKALHYSDGYCLLDPRLANWVLGLQINNTGHEQNVHLTPCERAILTLREQGLKASEIAQLRSISQTTVKKHLQNAARKRLLPPCELLLALFLIVGVWPKVIAIVAVGLLAIFTVSMAINIAKGNRFPCNCFGQTRVEIGVGTLSRDGLMIVLGLLLALLSPWNTPGTWLLPLDISFLSGTNIVAFVTLGASLYLIILGVSEIDTIFHLLKKRRALF